MACPGAGAGSVSYDALTEGVHAFDVRAVDPAPGSTPGRSLRRTFIVDLTAPSVGIDSRLDGEHRPGVPIALEFSAGEHGVAFTCGLDGAAPEPCSSGWSMPARAPRRARGARRGHRPRRQRQLAVRPRRRPALRRHRGARRAGRARPTDHRDRPGGAARRAGPRGPPAGDQHPGTQRTARHATIRVVRTAGLRLAPARASVVNVLFDATPGARFARLTLRDFEGGARVRVLARTDLRVSPGERVRMHAAVLHRAPGPEAARRPLPPDGGDGPATIGAQHRLDGSAPRAPRRLRPGADRPMRAAAMRVRPLTIVVPLLLAALVAATFGVALAVLRQSPPRTARPAADGAARSAGRRRAAGGARRRARDAPRAVRRDVRRLPHAGRRRRRRAVRARPGRLRPSAAGVRRMLRTGSLDGVMQPDLLQGAAARRVAAYVARVAGRR